jgi:acetyltransferase-like isoleucine patch superfamily enzyme
MREKIVPFIENTVKIPQPNLVNIYGARIGAYTKIGAFVEIQEGVIIGARCKISSHTFICTGVTIEDEVFIGHGVMFTNDKYPRACNSDGSMKGPNDYRLLETVVKKGAAVGSGAVILPGVVIGENAVIGAGAIVTKSILPNTTYINDVIEVIRAAQVDKKLGNV